jgi:hypothetical protein
MLGFWLSTSSLIRKLDHFLQIIVSSFQPPRGIIRDTLDFGQTHAKHLSIDVPVWPMATGMAYDMACLCM